jgi:ribosomal protein S18 acetylase RimI-like enzyme
MGRGNLRCYCWVMDMRPATLADAAAISEIDGVIQSTQYLHVERTGDGLTMSMRVEPRPCRERLTVANPVTDEIAFAFRQVASGADEGIALVLEHEGRPVAAAVARPRHEHRVMQLVDLRVDYSHRRQGLGQSLVYRIIMETGKLGLRAVMAEATADNLPAAGLLRRCGFELCGIDARRRSNHDLVKESATLFWYASLD